MRSKWINRVLSVALLFTTLTASVSYTFTTAYAEEAGASTQQSAQSGVSWPEAPEISAGNGILIDADTGAILYEKNAYTKCYPASTTKILTGLLTVENCSMDETVTFSIRLHGKILTLQQRSANSIRLNRLCTDFYCIPPMKLPMVLQSMSVVLWKILQK